MQTEYFAKKVVIHKQFGSRIDQLVVFYGKCIAAKINLFVVVVDEIPVFFLHHKPPDRVERCRGFGFYLQKSEKFRHRQKEISCFIFVQRINRYSSQLFYLHIHGNFFHFALLRTHFQRVWIKH